MNTTNAPGNNEPDRLGPLPLWRDDGGRLTRPVAEVGAGALRRDHLATVARRKIADLPSGRRIVGWEDLGAAGVRYSFASFQRDLFGDKPVWGPVTHSTVVTPSEYLAEFDRVEREDHECAACVRGFEWSGWNYVTGHRFSRCSRCGGTALPR